MRHSITLYRLLFWPRKKQELYTKGESSGSGTLPCGLSYVKREEHLESILIAHRLRFCTPWAMEGAISRQARLNLRCWPFWRTGGATSSSPNSLLLEFSMQPLCRPLVLVAVSASCLRLYPVSFHFQVSPRVGVLCLPLATFVFLCLPFFSVLLSLVPVPLSFFCLPLPPSLFCCSDCRCPSSID